MIPLPTGVRVWLATGCTDMRKGFPSLALQVQEILQRDPLSGHLFCFRGRRGKLLKVIWHDGQGACLFTKRLHRRRTHGEELELSLLKRRRRSHRKRNGSGC
jgi:transposase